MTSTAALSRLNAKTQSFTDSGGGRPDMTTAEIAAALGSVKGELQQQMLTLLWCPGLSDPYWIARCLVEPMTGEWQVMMMEVVCAEHDHALATDDGELEAILAAERKLAKAKLACWPKPGGGKYPKLIRMAMDEFREPGKCQHCNGTGQVTEGEKVKACRHCGGTGNDTAFTSAASRARKFSGIDPRAWQRTWAAPYQWILDVMAEAYRDGAKQFRKLTSDETED
mgnify:CR=1 FL=1